MAALVSVAGPYMLAAVEDMLCEAHESAEDTRSSAISFLAGFALSLIVAGILSQVNLFQPTQSYPLIEGH